MNCPRPGNNLSSTLRISSVASAGGARCFCSLELSRPRGLEDEQMISVFQDHDTGTVFVQIVAAQQMTGHPLS